MRNEKKTPLNPSEKTTPEKPRPAIGDLDVMKAAFLAALDEDDAFRKRKTKRG